MPPPSQIQIATSSLSRLLKEEASYFKELSQQEARLAKLERGEEVDGVEEENREYVVAQERKAIQETQNVLPSMRERITNSREKLESYLDTATNHEEREKAVKLIQQAKEAQKDDPTSVDAEKASTAT